MKTLEAKVTYCFNAANLTTEHQQLAGPSESMKKNVTLTRRPLTSGQTLLTPKYRLKRNVGKSANIIHCVLFNDPKLPLNSIGPVSC